MTLIAEYVEDEPVFSMLCELGVDYAQGHLFGRPVPIDSVLAELTDHCKALAQ